MKHKYHLFISASVIIAALSSSICHSDISLHPNSATKVSAELDTTKPQYTFLKDCQDVTHHDNAAFTKLSCKSLAEYQVNITQQSPQYFNIILLKNEHKISSDFTTVSHENPVKPSKAIEWHIVNNEPKFMIFRLSWGTANEPFKMREHLVVNLVTDNEICALAKVDVKKNKNANQKARDLISNTFIHSSSCPSTVSSF